MFIENKLINHTTKKGKKTKSEKILNNSIKELQKCSKKQTKELIKLSIIRSSRIFKLKTIKNKKNKKQKARIQHIFIHNKNKRFYFAIKLIVSSSNKAGFNNFHNNLKKEIFDTARFENNLIKTNREFEKLAFKQKHLFKYYRWN